MMIKPSKENVFAIVVTYFPDEGFSERLSAIAGQVSKVVVVDNASSGKSKKMIESVCRASSVHLISNTSNEGVACALNRGYRWGVEQGYAWALTFDQDTLADKALLESMLDAYERIGDERAAVIGCNYFDPYSRTLAYKNTKGALWEQRRQVITAGALVSLLAYAETGGFREDFFIDLVDEEFCFKCLLKEYKVFFIFKQLMVHPLGRARYHYFLGIKRFILLHHIPERTYYIVRNNLIFCSELFLRFPLYAIRKACLTIFSTVLVLLFEENKLRKFKYFLLGLWDGLLHSTTRKIL